MTKNRKIIILGAIFLVSVLLIAISFSNGAFRSKPVDNSYYKDNPYTGEQDFVDPDQTPEKTGYGVVTLRNGDRLASGSVNFFDEVRQRLSEYYVVNHPDDTEMYILKDSLVVDGNIYTFTVQGGTSKSDVKVIAYLTRQNTANVYINGDGPFNSSSRYFKESQNPIPN